MMKTRGIVVLAAMVVLIGASMAHAGKRLTTASSGFTDSVECTVVNVSDTKTITLDITGRDLTGAVVQQADGVILGPLQGVFQGINGNSRWCEFVIVDGGSGKDIRASMVVYENGAVVTIEPAREK